MRRRIAGVAVVVLAVVAAGCAEADKSIEARIKSTLNKTSGISVEIVDCPRDLVPEKVQQAECVASGDFSKYVRDKLGIESTLDKIGVIITFDATGEPRAAIDDARLAADLAQAAAVQLSDAPPGPTETTVVPPDTTPTPTP